MMIDSAACKNFDSNAHKTNLMWERRILWTVIKLCERINYCILCLWFAIEKASDTHESSHLWL